MKRSTYGVCVLAAHAAAASCCFAADAQAPAASPAPPTAAATAPTALDPLAWLRGCWAGNVNRRDYVEQWLPPRADMMLGVSHTVVQDRRHAGEWRTEDYTYLRLEARPDGVYYVVVVSGQKELPFKLTGVDNAQGDNIFTFTRPDEGFPQRITYRHTQGGLLFAEVAGKVDGKNKEVTYPMSRVDCASGATARE